MRLFLTRTFYLVLLFVLFPALVLFSGPAIMSSLDVPSIIAKAITFSTNIIVNEDGNAVNTRMESDTNSNMLCIDGTNNRVGVGTCTPAVFMETRNDANSATQVRVTNATDGTSARAMFSANSTVGAFEMGVRLPANTETANVADAGLVRTDSDLSGGVVVGTGGSNPFRIITNDTLRFTIFGGSNTVRMAQTADCDTITPGAVGELCVQNSATCPVAISTGTAVAQFACLTLTTP